MQEFKKHEINGSHFSWMYCVMPFEYRNTNNVMSKGTGNLLRKSLVTQYKWFGFEYRFQQRIVHHDSTKSTNASKFHLFSRESCKKRLDFLNYRWDIFLYSFNERAQGQAKKL